MGKLVKECNGISLSTFFPSIATFNDPSEAVKPCTATSGATCKYTGDVATPTCNYAFVTAVPDTTSYTVAFCLEDKAGSFPAGAHTISTNGIR